MIRDSARYGLLALYFIVYGMWEIHLSLHAEGDSMVEAALGGVFLLGGLYFLYVCWVKLKSSQ